MNPRRARGGWGRRELLVGVGAVAVGAMVAAWLLDEDSPERGGRYPTEASLPVGTLGDSDVGVELLAAARAGIQGGGIDASALSSVPGKPVYVCAHRQPVPPACARGEGSTLKAAVQAAAASVGKAVGGGPFERVSVDVEVATEAVRMDALGSRKRDPGLWGYRVGAAFVVPSDVLATDIYGGGENDKEFRPAQLIGTLRKRFGAEISTSAAAEQFRTVAWVEGADGNAVRTYRLHRYDPEPVGADDLERSAVWAADHLASTISSDGKIRYTFDVSEGKAEAGYNLLRHGGSTYSLLQAYQRTQHEPWLHASEAAIGYLLRHSQRDVRQGPFGGGDTLWVKESSFIKLGGAGLALVMLTQHHQATGSDKHLDDAKAYARFLVSQQAETGEFVYFANLKPGGPPRDRDSAYYPGEAILGLMQLYAIDPDPLWLATAMRGADWLIQVRDRGKGASKLENDHWLMIALSHLVHQTGEARYIEHSQALAAAVSYQASRNVSKVSTHLDYAGGYYDPPRSTPAATRGEGLVAVLDTCATQSKACTKERELLLATVQHSQWSQMAPDLLWWMPAPGEAVGAFTGGVMDPDLRNDFTQHNLSAVLGAERHLRVTERVLPGGPGWSWASQSTSLGMPPERLEQLLSPLRKVRGRHFWDAVAGLPPDPEDAVVAPIEAGSRPTK